VRVLAIASIVVMATGACGGTLEENYRRNQPTGTGPTTTQPSGRADDASVGRRGVRFFHARSAALPPAGQPPHPAPATPGAAGAPGAPGAPAAPAPAGGTPVGATVAAPASSPVARAAGGPRSAPAPMAVTSPPPPTEEGVTATIVVMGGAIPLSGPLGAIGRQELYGFDARVQRINDAGGIHGRRLKLVVHDDGLDPARDRALFHRLVETEHVFSAFASGSVRAVADYACRDVADPVPLVADVPTMPEPQVSPEYRCVFTTGPGTRHAAWMRAQKAKGLGAASIGVIMSDQPPWEDAAAMAAEAEAIYERAGLKNKGKVRLPLGADSCDDQVRSMLAQSPEYLFINVATVRDLHRCVAAMRRINWKPRVATELALPADEVVAGAGPFAEGFLSTSIFLPADDPAPAMAEYRADLARYHPDAEAAAAATLGAYLAAKITEQLLTAAGPDLTRPAFLRAAEGLGGWDSGMGPTITWSPTARVGVRKMSVLTATGGRFVPTGEILESACPESACAP
jgi:branched-chain amino acid transport system substrate-binding protein